MFSSDLQRAVKTARAICEEQWNTFAPNAEPKNKLGNKDLKETAQAEDKKVQVEASKVQIRQLALLREKDFGDREGVSYLPPKKSLSKPQPARKSSSTGESAEDVKARMILFLESCLVPLQMSERQKPLEIGVAVVSHGIALGVLWRCIFQRFTTQNVRLAPGVSAKRDNSLEHLGGWVNTGYLELRIRHKENKTVSSLTLLQKEAALKTKQEDVEKDSAKKARSINPIDWTVNILAINSRVHLQGLKRTGGGVGSSKFDAGQKSINSFFKKQKLG